MRKKSLIGLVATVVGLAAMGGSYFVVTEAQSRNRDDQVANARVEDRCREKVSEFASYRPQGGRNGMVVVTMNEAADPRDALSEATAVLAVCPHRRVVDACFGTMCGPNGTPSEMLATLTLATN